MYKLDMFSIFMIYIDIPFSPLIHIQFILSSWRRVLPGHLPRKLQNALSTAEAAVFQNPFVRQIDDEASRNGVQEKDPEIIGIVLKQWMLRLQIYRYDMV